MYLEYIGLFRQCKDVIARSHFESLVPVVLVGTLRYRPTKVCSLISCIYLVCSVKFFPQNVKTCIKSFTENINSLKRVSYLTN